MKKRGHAWELSEGGATHPLTADAVFFDLAPRQRTVTTARLTVTEASRPRFASLTGTGSMVGGEGSAAVPSRASLASLGAGPAAPRKLGPPAPLTAPPAARARTQPPPACRTVACGSSAADPNGVSAAAQRPPANPSPRNRVKGSRASPRRGTAEAGGRLEVGSVDPLRRWSPPQSQSSRSAPRRTYVPG